MQPPSRFIAFQHIRSAVRSNLAFPYQVLAGLVLSWAGVSLCLYIGKDVHHHLCLEWLGCERILTSPYSKFFGIPLSAFGCGFYGLTFALFGYCGLVTGKSFKFGRTLLTFLLEGGVGISVGLLFIQIAILHGLCSLCTTSLILAILLMAIALSLPGTSTDELRKPTATYLTLLFLPGLTYVVSFCSQVPANDPAVFFIDGNPYRRSVIEPAFTGVLNRVTQMKAKLTKDVIRKAAAEIILQNEAHTAGMTKEQYLEKLIGASAEASSKTPLPLRQNQASLDGETGDDAIDRLLTKHELKISKEILPSTVVKLDERYIIFDRPDPAPVTLVIFSDFECPYCADLAPSIKKLQETFKDCLRVGVWQFPLPFHSRAQPAAIAASAAAEQGKFWAYYDRLYQTEDLSDQNLEKIADEIGLDVESFKKTIAASQTATYLDAGYKLAKSYGIVGTPTVFLNDTELDDASPEEVTAAVKAACSRSRETVNR